MKRPAGGELMLLCVPAGSHADAVVELRPVERRALRRVAGGHLHGRDQLSGPGRHSLNITKDAVVVLHCG